MVASLSSRVWTLNSWVGMLLLLDFTLKPWKPSWEAPSFG